MARCFSTTSLFISLFTTAVGSLTNPSAEQNSSSVDISRNPLPIVSTSIGRVVGHLLDLPQGKKVIVYRGIPYAEPPVAKLRFKPPVARSPSTELINATTFGPLCVQSKSRSLWDLQSIDNGTRVLRRHGLWDYRQSEDCLNLNIYVPSQVAAELRSVMIYIHGGSYKTNGGRFYPGEWLAASGDVVVVTLNYRLGVLGFLSTNDDVASGNYGLLDQVMAMKWVKENIAGFGGNSEDVTIFGNSAGGACVGLHLLSPLSQGLFRKAIVQSGSPIGEWAVQKNPRVYVEQLALKLGCVDVKNSYALVDCLRNIPAPFIIDKSEEAKTLEDSLMIQFAPVVDGSFILDTPTKRLLNASYIQIPVMVGITKDELEVWMTKSYQDKDPSSTPFTKDLLRKYLLHLIRKDSMADSAIDILLHAVYSEYAIGHYTAGSRGKNIASIPDVRILGKIISDIDLKAPSVKFAQLLSMYSNAAVFMYEFDYASPDDVIFNRHTGSNNTWVGSYHESELYYVFGFPHLEVDNALRLKEDREVSETMVRLWSNFAKFGFPTPDGHELSYTNFTWTMYTEIEKCYAVLGLHPHVSRSYEPERMIFWNHFVPLLTEYDAAFIKDCNIELLATIAFVGWMLFLLCFLLILYRLICRRFGNTRMQNFPIPI